MYDHNALRGRVAASAWTLLVAFLATVGLWQVPFFAQPEGYYTLGATLVAAYVMVNVVNRFTLIRVRSRLTTTAMLLLLALVSDTTHFSAYTLLPLLLVAVYACLLWSAEDHTAMHLFHAFVVLGSMVLMTPLAVGVVAVAYVSMLVFFRSWRLQYLSASVLGLLLPLVAVAGFAVWQPARATALTETYYAEVLALPWVDYTTVGIEDLVIYGCFALVSLPAIVHIIMDRGEEKQQVRAMFGFLSLLQIVLLAGAAVLPNLSGVWWPLLAVNSSPLVAHHLAVSRRVVTDLWFYVVVAVWVASVVLTRCVGWIDWTLWAG